MSQPAPITINPSGAALIKRRTIELKLETLDSVYRDRDRVFGYLFIAQWVFAIAVALLWSPYGWEGKVQTTHLHVYLAIFLGALLCLPPLLLIKLWPGEVLTRHLIAVVQMLWSALLIHLSGGRIETHFHIFGSLAFLSFYRDYHVLFTATLVVALEHLLRELMWPESVYGVTNPEWWRFLEHAFWVAFEDIVLVMSIIDTRRTLAEISRRQAETEWLNASLEQKVNTRTEALFNANQHLQGSLSELRLTQRQLIEASRKAGMADVATSVLHNVGNVLNSVNVSATMVSEAVRASKSGGLAKAVALLNDQPDPGRFLCEDPKGKRLLEYFGVISKAIDEERERNLRELTSLTKNVDHIKIIVGMQQSYARPGGARERISLRGIIDDAIKTNSASYEKHEIETTKELAAPDAIECDPHKLFQILINLLSNAKQAIKEHDGEKRIIIRTRLTHRGLLLEVEDSGAGIAPENLEKIFSHGFTTKKDGHGFGLHSCANAATEMGGGLTVHSDGPGKGARFTLQLPLTSSAALRAV